MSTDAPARRGPSRRVAADDRRAVCIWLGTLASWRQGLVGRLVREYGSVARVLETPPAELAAAAARRRARLVQADAATGAARAETEGDAHRFDVALKAGPAACVRAADAGAPSRHTVAWCDPLYPAQLRKLADPPLCLFVQSDAGDAAVAARLAALAAVPAVAVVGTRAPSTYGEDMARLLGRDLARAGLIVVSGLALGVDAVAQSAALGVPAGDGRPRTVAVLGSGADVPYPRTNLPLYGRVAAEGLVVSEFAWGVPARAWRFPARNRVMAALARAVVLVEGTERSGARITAGFALDLGREVLCVPGEAGRRLSAAPNQLLRDGAKVCEGAADVLRAIAVDDPADLAVGAVPGAAAEALVLDHGGGAVREVLRALERGPLTVDELARRCRMPAAKAAAAASELEVDGLARRGEGGRYRLRR